MQQRIINTLEAIPCTCTLEGENTCKYCEQIEISQPQNLLNLRVPPTQGQGQPPWAAHVHLCTAAPQVSVKQKRNTLLIYLRGSYR